MPRHIPLVLVPITAVLAMALSGCATLPAAGAAATADKSAEKPAASGAGSGAASAGSPRVRPDGRNELPLPPASRPASRDPSPT